MGGLTASTIVAWAASRWQAEVGNRPLQNVHRRALDGTWRQVIRHFGGDDDALCGLAHDELIKASPPPTNLHSAVRELLDLLTPGIVLTVGGVSINHAGINVAKQKVQEALD